MIRVPEWLKKIHPDDSMHVTPFNTDWLFLLSCLSVTIILQSSIKDITLQALLLNYRKEYHEDKYIYETYSKSYVMQSQKAVSF